MTTTLGSELIVLGMCSALKPKHKNLLLTPLSQSSTFLSTVLCSFSTGSRLGL